MYTHTHTQTHTGELCCLAGQLLVGWLVVFNVPSTARSTLVKNSKWRPYKIQDE